MISAGISGLFEHAAVGVAALTGVLAGVAGGIIRWKISLQEFSTPT